MELLVTLKPIQLKGELLQPGELFKAADPQPLIDKGYARVLTVEEVTDILGSYVAYAQMVFAEKPLLGSGGKGQTIDIPPTEKTAQPFSPRDAKHCGDRPVPFGTCQKHKMKFHKVTKNLEPYCTKRDAWCWVLVERTKEPGTLRAEEGPHEE